MLVCSIVCICMFSTWVSVYAHVRAFVFVVCVLLGRYTTNQPTNKQYACVRVYLHALYLRRALVYSCVCICAFSVNVSVCSCVFVCVVCGATLR